MNSMKSANTFRKYHRILGFFLAGIMVVYSLSGTLLIFRATPFLKYEKTEEHILAPGLAGEEVGEKLRVKGFKVVEENADFIKFREGSYNKSTGHVIMTKEDYPLLIAKMVKLHKATTNSPLFFMNILFGAALLFFSISSFFMFMWKLPVYKTGLKFAAAGFVLAIIMVLTN